MLFKSQELYEEFYTEIKDKYPHLSYEDVSNIVRYPFKYLKNMMEGSIIAEFRITYFGVFKVYPKRAKSLFESLEKNYKNNYIDKEKYMELKKMLNNYINEAV